MKIEIPQNAQTIIKFTLDDGRVIEMKICGRESRMGVLGNKYDEQMTVNRNDVAELYKQLRAKQGY